MWALQPDGEAMGNVQGYYKNIRIHPLETVNIHVISSQSGLSFLYNIIISVSMFSCGTRI